MLGLFRKGKSEKEQSDKRRNDFETAELRMEQAMKLSNAAKVRSQGALNSFIEELSIPCKCKKAKAS
jgi:hypothetical protein|tara:strand:+ start:507 stop:707 length:201 start_codon:yes stop_codon:yes gene_type:complete